MSIYAIIEKISITIFFCDLCRVKGDLLLLAIGINRGGGFMVKIWYACDKEIADSTRLKER